MAGLFQLFRGSLRFPGARGVLLFGLLVSTHSLHGQQVIAWGVNTSGQTNVPAAATNVVAVAAGNAHSMALRDDGTVLVWGSNASGLTNVPASATNVMAIAAGGAHCLALRSNGTVVAWGNNSSFQCNVPVSASNVIAIAAGEGHSLALRNDGRAIAWGRSGEGQSPAPVNATNVVRIFAGQFHNLAITADDKVVAWGLNAPKKLPSYILDPDPVAFSCSSLGNLMLTGEGIIRCYPSRFIPANFTNLVAIAAGTNYILALNASGRPLVRGHFLSVTNIPSSATNLTAIAAGGAHGLAIRGNGAPKLLTGLPHAKSASVGDFLPAYARATAAAPFHYRWLVDGVLVETSTNLASSIPVPPNTPEVSCQLVVSNHLGSVTSEVATISIRAMNIWGDNASAQRKQPASVVDPIAVSAGSFHLLALDADGGVVAWGKNFNGQTNVPPAATNVVAVAGGGHHSLALRDDGTVLAWGRNWDGQTNAPPTATNVVAIAAGLSHNLALRGDGTVLAWGNNEYGQSSVSFLAQEVASIAAGHYHSLALRTDGVVVGWGEKAQPPTNATSVVAIAAGFEHSLALKSDGTVLAWGDNSFGQTQPPPQATNVIAIAAGFYHSAALCADGTVLSWGRKNFGVTNVPPAMSNALVIATGEDFSAAISGSGAPRFGRQLQNIVTFTGSPAIIRASGLFAPGTTFQWYRNSETLAGATNLSLTLNHAGWVNSGSYVLVASNAFGAATNTPVIVTVQPQAQTVTGVGAWGDDVGDNEQIAIPPNLINPRAVAAGGHHSLALQADGTIIAWGKNWAGQTNVPLEATNVTAIAAGGNHSLALRGDGSVLAWGQHWNGETNVPPAATNIVAIAAGWAHSLALRDDGKVLAWGNNDFGQTNTPPYLENVVAIAAGYYHNLALRADRTVVSWGLREFVPPSATNVLAIAAGRDQSLALRMDGSLIAWGDAQFGQTDVPPAATNVIAMAAGFHHTVAMLADGSVLTWGDGRYGVTNLPFGLRNVVAVGAGENHNLVLTELGPPRLSATSLSATQHVGGQLTLTPSASGSPPLSYQWSRGITPMAGETNRSLQLSSVGMADAGGYVLHVTNSAGLAAALAFDVSVLPEPKVVGNLKPKRLTVGMPLCLFAGLGETPLAVQWYRNGIALADDARVTGSTSAQLCIATTTYADSGTYSVTLSNAFGFTSGEVAKVIVTPLVAWGDNSSGQLDAPANATNIIQVVSREDFNVALRGDGSVIAWGDNSFGQTNVPAGISNAIGVAAGAGHGMALLFDGRVLAWGDHRFGQRHVPASATNVVAVAAGGVRSYALRADGSVVEWPVNYSQTNSSRILYTNGVTALAVRLDDLVAALDTEQVVTMGTTTNAGVVALAAGSTHAVVQQTNGNILVLGTDSYGLPMPTATTTGALALAAGGDFSLALDASGSVAAWGDNFFNQLQPPPSATNLAAISAGFAHGLGLSRSNQGSMTFGTFTKSVVLGNSATLAVTVSPGAVQTYQWQFNGNNIPGATNATLMLGSAHWTNAGLYRVIISNASGSSQSPDLVLNIQRTPLRFDTSPLLLGVTNAGFSARVLGAAGLGEVVVFASPDFQNWIPIYTNPPTMQPIDFTEAVTDIGTNRFYRAVELEGSNPP